MNTRFSSVGLWLTVILFNTSASASADDHAPIGVMADHYHEAGEFMLSYRYMSMSMKGNLIGDDSVAPSTIATTIPNRFFGMPMQPPTLRVVPTEMTMDMQMLGFMYAPTAGITLMAMLNHVSKEMDHITFQGPVGTMVLGGFTTKTSGLGDTSLSALMRLYETDTSRLHATLGVSVPTGNIDETGTILAPTGMTPTPRLPYPMQLGSGTYDLLGGLTYSRFYERWSWGSQWRSVIRSGDNDEGYMLGDEHRFTAWYSRLLSPEFSWSARIEYFERGNIDGIDPLIMAPVQTADPSFQGAARIDAALGLNYANEGGHRLSLELIAPLDQDLDGPQLETDTQLILGYQYSF
ncbi:MAG: transporter [Candidatus Rariloculaceae bacterium]